jgi:hypothetical protein
MAGSNTDAGLAEPPGSPLDSMKQELYLGMRDGDLAGKAYAQYWNPVMLPVAGRPGTGCCCGPAGTPAGDRECRLYALDGATSASKELSEGAQRSRVGWAIAAGGRMP